MIAYTHMLHAEYKSVSLDQFIQSGCSSRYIRLAFSCILHFWSDGDGCCRNSFNCRHTTLSVDWGYTATSGATQFGFSNLNSGEFHRFPHEKHSLWLPNPAAIETCSETAPKLPVEYTQRLETGKVGLSNLNSAEVGLFSVNKYRFGYRTQLLRDCSKIASGIHLTTGDWNTRVQQPEFTRGCSFIPVSKSSDLVAELSFPETAPTISAEYTPNSEGCYCERWWFDSIEYDYNRRYCT